VIRNSLLAIPGPKIPSFLVPSGFHDDLFRGRMKIPPPPWDGEDLTARTFMTGSRMARASSRPQAENLTDDPLHSPAAA